MRTSTPRYCQAFLLFFALLLSTFSIADTPVMTIAYAEYQPYSFAENGQAQGIEVDILSEALSSRMNIALKHSILPWKRVQKYVKNGEIDAYVAIATPERLSYADASQEAVTYGSVSAFLHVNDIRLNGTETLTLRDLKPYRLGVVAGSGWAKRNLTNHFIQPAYSTSALAEMLKLKRIDIIVENPYIFNYHLKQFADDEFNVKEIPIANQKLSLVLFINKSSPFAKILPEFDATLREMLTDGTLEKINANYR